MQERNTFIITEYYYIQYPGLRWCKPWKTLPNSKIVARRSILQTFLKKRAWEENSIEQLLITTTKQLWHGFHGVTLLRFKSNKADWAVTSGVRCLRHGYHTSAAQIKPTEVTVEKSLCHNTECTQPLCLRCKEMNCKLHWWIASNDTFLCLTLLQSGGLIVCLLVFMQKKKNIQLCLFVWCKPSLAFIQIFAVVLTPALKPRFQPD